MAEIFQFPGRTDRDKTPDAKDETGQTDGGNLVEAADFGGRISDLLRAPEAPRNLAELFEAVDLSVFGNPDIDSKANDLIEMCRRFAPPEIVNRVIMGLALLEAPGGENNYRVKTFPIPKERYKFQTIDLRKQEGIDTLLELWERRPNNEPLRLMSSPLFDIGYIQVVIIHGIKKLEGEGRYELDFEITTNRSWTDPTPKPQEIHRKKVEIPLLFGNPMINTLIPEMLFSSTPEGAPPPPETTAEYPDFYHTTSNMLLALTGALNKKAGLGYPGQAHGMARKLLQMAYKQCGMDLDIQQTNGELDPTASYVDLNTAEGWARIQQLTQEASDAKRPFIMLVAEIDEEGIWNTDVPAQLVWSLGTDKYEGSIMWKFIIWDPSKNLTDEKIIQITPGQPIPTDLFNSHRVLLLKPDQDSKTDIRKLATSALENRRRYQDSEPSSEGHRLAQVAFEWAREGIDIPNTETLSAFQDALALAEADGYEVAPWQYGINMTDTNKNLTEDLLARFQRSGGRPIRLVRRPEGEDSNIQMIVIDRIWFLNGYRQLRLHVIENPQLIEGAEGPQVTSPCCIVENGNFASLYELARPGQFYVAFPKTG